jgi:hypothetical protein
MKDKLKKCPFCNTLPTVGGGLLVKPMCDCYGEFILFEWDKWQNRPIENTMQEEESQLYKELSFAINRASQINFLYTNWEERGSDLDQGDYVIWDFAKQILNYEREIK